VFACHILEKHQDNIDEIVVEANSIYRLNPWLTYGEPLHRVREFGVRPQELDLIDEVRLSADQILRVIVYL
jgi:hypothetical protein